MNELTFEMLSDLEPGLKRLREDIQEARPRGWSDVQILWYRGFKPRMHSLVGFMRDDNHPILSTSEAYDVCYHTLYRQLESRATRRKLPT